MKMTTKPIILLVAAAFFLTGRIVAPLPVLAADKISKSAPQFKSTPVEDVADLEQEDNKLGAGTWILALVGVAVLAALGGGGGGGGGGTSTPPTTGDVTAGW